MTAFIIRRLIQSVFVLLLVTVITFLALRLLPGDPIYMLLTSEEVQLITPEEVEVLRHQHGLDRPLAVQYFSWLGNLLQGDFGTSIYVMPSIPDLEALNITSGKQIDSICYNIVILIPLQVNNFQICRYFVKVINTDDMISSSLPMKKQYTVPYH